MGFGKLEVSYLLRVMATLLEIKGEDSFKVRSYEKAADSIETGGYNLEEMALQGRLQEIPGVGKNLEPKIKELVLEGKSSFLERLLKEVPLELLELLKVPGIGAKTARLLHENLGIENLSDLERALNEHKVAGLPGIGPKREQLIASGLLQVKKYIGRVPLGVVLPYAETICDEFVGKGIEARLSGEIRRACETVSSLDLIVEDVPDQDIISVLSKLGLEPAEAGQRWGKSGDLPLTQLPWVLIQSPLGVPVRLLKAARPDFWFQVFLTTGPEEHLAWAKSRGSNYGYDINEKGVFKDGKKVFLSRETDIYELLETTEVPPEVRHRPEFWQKAAAGEDIRLVEANDIKGDLHIHTSWSDGMGSIEDMVQKAMEMGYSYLAITDHATNIRLINGLTPEKLSKQMKEIDEISGKYGDIKILKGVEVDILKDGTLFLPDSVLRDLDFVIASVHEDLGDDRGNLRDRLISAVQNPLVHMIGHPTGRLMGRRAGYSGRFEDILEKAKCSGTALEVNSSPYRIDLNEILASQALDSEVNLIVTTDAHSPEGMNDIRFGVLSSLRRAGAAPNQVANCLDLGAFLDRLKKA